ncbi:MAG: cytochrome c-type biosis protein CcmH [Blastocatellia bacterium]|jgi:cytochrome c-type biogenesis protein CcmH|nr:cytochrome c-type biosis protein CcmH [Blastocatellia bacterium]
MLIFWIIVALFILFALWFVLPPLLHKSDADKGDDLRAANVLIYQDQFKEMETDLKNGLVSEEQYQQDKEELERRLLEDVGAPSSDLSSSSTTTRKVAYGVGLAIPIGVIALYFVIGNPNGLGPSLPQMASAAPQQGGPMTSQQIAANVEKLAKKLEQNPNDGQGWLMLARSYLSMERFADAAAAYEHATTLNGNDASVWADYAEAAAMANGQRLAGKPTEAINRALQIDPKQQKALDLAGSAAYQAGDYKKAIDYWQKLLAQLPAGSEELRAISEQIAKARQMAGDKGTK